MMEGVLSPQCSMRCLVFLRGFVVVACSRTLRLISIALSPIAWIAIWKPASWAFWTSFYSFSWVM
jgi:hypothetical protein